MSRLKEESTVRVVVTVLLGSGKTAFVADVVQTMRERGWPVLAIRVDQVAQETHSAGLAQRFGFEVSPSQILAAAAETVENPGVLVVDQLDAVSAMSGRSSNAFNVVDELLREVDELRSRITIHVIIVCREFDWRHDAQLRQLVPETDSENRINVTEFSIDKVKEILCELNYDMASLKDSQLQLLQLPQNLSLLTESCSQESPGFTFGTAMDLFDKYWDAKKQAVERKTPSAAAQWMGVIKKLCDRMASMQQLSVPRETLDDFSSDYVKDLVSEGVLVCDDNSYGFGHESFFDYCFARIFFSRSDSSLASLLKESEQHLFRRAQVRQVLAYLRDKDRSRYIREHRGLFSDETIRPHIKDLALALFFGVADPNEKEWQLCLEWINPMIESIKAGERPQNKMTEVAWQWFFLAPSWFEQLDQREKIEQWLASENSRIVDMAVNYLRIHQRYFPDRVAQLLEPYVDRGGEWRSRFCYLAEWADHSKSRKFFDLMLRLIENGSLDEARAAIATNGTFWLIFSNLRDGRLNWVPEILASWLQRRFSILCRAGVRGRDLFGGDNFLPQLVEQSARRYPDIFVRYMLPVVLDISDVAASGTEPPRSNSVWSFLARIDRGFNGQDACLYELGQALATSARESSGDLSSAISLLRGCETYRDMYVSNYLLLTLYAGGGKSYADEAIELLCNEPWRFECGFSGSENWCAAKVIREAVPNCSHERLEELEEVLLSYVPSFERTARGRAQLGRASFDLLDAIPPKFRSDRANKRWSELQRKFGEPRDEPHKFIAQKAQSPIQEDKARHMDDDQWRDAIEKYANEEPTFDAGGRFMGGAQELARVFADQVKRKPEHFARFSLELPPGKPSAFVASALSALTDADIATDLKVQVCTKAFSELRGSADKQVSEEMGKAIADVLGKVEDRLPDDAVGVLGWLVTEHDDPAREVCRAGAGEIQYYGGDIYTHGINSVRGRSAEAIRSLIFSNRDYIDRFRLVLDQMARDSHPAALSCIAGAFCAVDKYDEDFGQTLFRQMDLSDGRLFATPHVEAFIRMHLKSFVDVRPMVESALRSPELEANEVGARLASLAALEHQSVADLVDEALHGNARHRLGVAQVAAANLEALEDRVWSERTLRELFDDDNEDVLREIASCFHSLGNAGLGPFEDFIEAFCNSMAFREDSASLLRVLKESKERLPKATCLVCERFLDQFSDEARDIQTARSAQVGILVKLVFRSYQQHQNDKAWAQRLLNLIDGLCLERISTEAKEQFALFDR